MKYPKKYLTANPNVMKREIKKHGGKEDDDSSAYGPWDADYKSRKAGKGKQIPTKQSKYTKKYKELFGEKENFESKNILDFDVFNLPDNLFEDIIIENTEITEKVIMESSMEKDGPIYKALKKKSDKTGFPLNILKKVWSRGYSAWKTGHIPGTTPQQWAMARVNSFVTGGKTTKMSDKALYDQAKKNKKQKR